MKKLKKTIGLVLAILLVLSALTLTACGNNDAPTVDDPPADAGQEDAGDAGQEDAGNGGDVVVEPPPGDDHLIVVVPGLPVSMDPHASNDMFTAYFVHQIYDQLVRLDPEDPSNVEPALAVEWYMPDMQTLSMTLREGVYFHNGEPLTANDVRFSLLRTLNSPHVGFIVGMIDDVVVHDDLNFDILLTQPFAPMINHLGHFGTSILHEQTVLDAGDDYHLHPIGTGAFKFDSIVLGDRIEMSRFDDYWGPTPAIESVTWRAMPEANNRLLEVEAGNAHLGIIIDASDINRVMDSPNIELHRRTSLQAIYLGMHVEKEPFDNVLVRQAINYALDVEEISYAVYWGSGTPATSAITSIVWGYYPQEPFPFDVDRARELMAEAGLEDGFSTTLWYNTEDQQLADMATIIQSQLRAIDIDVTVESMDWATYLDRTSAGENEMFLLSWFTVTGDADYGLFDTFHVSGLGSGNRTFWSSPEVDALLEEGRETLDADRRLEIYREVQRLVHEASPRVYIHHAEELHISVPELQNVILHPDGRIDVWSVFFAN